MKMHPPLQFRFMLPESRATSHIFIRLPGLQVGGVFGVGIVSGVGVVCGVGVIRGLRVVRGVVKISHLGFCVLV